MVALSGRSNVGKSSLLNRLVGRRIAAVSRTPGRTRKIAFYPTKSITWVDLPGYGYARTAHTTQEAWLSEVKAFLRTYRPLVVILLDARIPPQALDLAWTRWLAQNALPFCILANKIDALSQKDLHRQKQILPAAFPEPVYWGWISARTGAGIPAFLSWLQGSAYL